MPMKTPTYNYDRVATTLPEATGPRGEPKGRDLFNASIDISIEKHLYSEKKTTQSKRTRWKEGLKVDNAV